MERATPYIAGAAVAAVGVAVIWGALTGRLASMIAAFIAPTLLTTGGGTIPNQGSPGQVQPIPGQGSAGGVAQDILPILGGLGL